MWIVEKNLHLHKVDIIFDGKKPAYAIYLDCDDDPNAYKVNDDDLLFTSKGEAEKYIDERRQKIILQMGEVKKFIENIDYIDMGEYTYEEKDYLGYKATAEDYSERQYNEQRRLNGMLKNYIMRGTINIDAYTFKYSEVKQVKWCKKQNTYFATLILGDGTEARTNTEEEYEFIKFLFGENNSDRIFNK